MLRHLIEMDRKENFQEGGLKQFGKLKFTGARAQPVQTTDTAAGCTSMGPQPFSNTATVTIALPAQTTDTGSTSMGHQTCLNSVNCSKDNQDTDMPPVTDDMLNEFEMFKMFMKMKNRRAMLSKLNDSPCSPSNCKGLQHQPHAQQDLPLPESDGSYRHEDLPLDQPLEPQRLADLNVPNRSGCNANPAVDAAGCDHLDSLGSYPVNAAIRSSNKGLLANMQTMAEQGIPSKKRSRSEFPARKGTLGARHQDEKQASLPCSVN